MLSDSIATKILTFSLYSHTFRNYSFIIVGFELILVNAFTKTSWYTNIHFLCYNTYIKWEMSLNKWCSYLKNLNTEQISPNTKTIRTLKTMRISLDCCFTQINNRLHGKLKLVDYASLNSNDFSNLQTHLYILWPISNLTNLSYLL